MPHASHARESRVCRDSGKWFCTGGKLPATVNGMIAYCLDVGSVRRGAFGWARAHREAGTMCVKGGPKPDDLTDLMAGDIREGRPVTLGIVSPLFLPVPRQAKGLSAGRDREGNRSCFAPTGGYVATLGLHELAYVLARLKAGIPDLRATIDWRAWRTSMRSSMLVWEAFVTGKGHSSSGDHVQDAASAATLFLERLETDLQSDVTVEEPRDVLSLAGAALLWAGLATDLANLRRAALVVQPLAPWPGEIKRLARIGGLARVVHAETIAFHRRGRAESREGADGLCTAITQRSEASLATPSSD